MYTLCFAIVFVGYVMYVVQWMSCHVNNQPTCPVNPLLLDLSNDFDAALRSTFWTAPYNLLNHIPLKFIIPEMSAKGKK